MFSPSGSGRRAIKKFRLGRKCDVDRGLLSVAIDGDSRAGIAVFFLESPIRLIVKIIAYSMEVDKKPFPFQFEDCGKPGVIGL
jgi:hypothetical protein